MSPSDCAQEIAGLREEIRALREEIRQTLGMELLTVEEAAKLLKTSEGALRQAIRRGTVPSVHVPPGKRVRIRRQDLPIK